MMQTKPRTYFLLIVMLIFSACGVTAIFYFRSPQQQFSVPIEELTENHPDKHELVLEKASNNDYLGTDSCAECHASLVESYKKHPMYFGSVRPVSEIKEQLVSTSSPIKGKKRVLTVSASPESLLHHELMYDDNGGLIYDDSYQMTHVVGSGRRGLAFIHEKNNVLCLSPLNWFARGKNWELNPGYTPDDPRRFDRRAQSLCINCHAGVVNAREHGSEIFAKPFLDENEIGCEKCHGAGRQHRLFHLNQTKLQQDPIINPEKLDKFQQVSVCYQCHLLPASARILRPGKSHLDFRPGMRLDDVWIVFEADPSVDADGRTDSVRHVQQMMESKCYLGSKSLSCTSCHDPHSVPTETTRDDYFRTKCQSCHESSNACSAPAEIRSPVNDACANCHMPKLDLVLSAHAAQTDHRVLRNPKSAGNPTAKESSAGELKFFFEETHQLPENEKKRASAIAQTRKGPASEQLLSELSNLTEQFPEDGFLKLALGAAAVSRKDYPSAAKYLKQAAAIPQTEELALEILTQASYFAQDWPTALGSMDHMLRINPRRAQTLAIRADALLRNGQLEEAISSAKSALEANPSMAEVHNWLLQVYNRLGNTQLATQEQRSIERIKNAKPPTDTK